MHTLPASLIFFCAILGIAAGQSPSKPAVPAVPAVTPKPAAPVVPPKKPVAPILPKKPVGPATAPKKPVEAEKDKKDKEDAPMASMNAASLLPVGVPSFDVRMPEFAKDKLVSRLRVRQLTRLDDDRLDLEDMEMQRFHPDGTLQYTIRIQRGIYFMAGGNLISNTPTSLHGEDMELFGEGCRYAQSSNVIKILGNVTSSIYLKNTSQKPEDGDATPEANRVPATPKP